MLSSLATIGIQHWLGLRKQKYETRRYPREVLFNKQTEFYDKAKKVLDNVNSYITTLDVWLGETSPGAKEKVQEQKEKTEPVWEFSELMGHYSIYLPEKIIRAGHNLLEECGYLPHLPTTERTYRAIEALFSIENAIRECVGAAKLSEDLLKSFGAHKRKHLARRGR